MFFHSRKEIRALVNAVLTGDAGSDELLKLGDYDIDETWYFWVMYGIGSAVVTGTLSKQTARGEQNKAGEKFRGMAVQLFFWRKIRSEKIKGLRTYSVAVSKADRLLRARDAEGFLFALMDAFSDVLGESVHAEMFRKAFEDSDFKKKCIDTLIDNEEYFTERFKGAIGYETYLPLLEKFFAGCRDDGSAELFAGFGDDAGDVGLDKFDEREEFEKFAGNSKAVFGLKRVDNHVVE